MPMKPKISIAVLGIGPEPKRSMMPPKFGGKSAEPVKSEDMEMPTRPMEKAQESPETRGAAMSAVSPEAVCFRSAEQTCGNCRHMNDGGECDVLKCACAPGDSCNAFDEREVSTSESEEPEDEGESE